MAILLFNQLVAIGKFHQAKEIKKKKKTQRKTALITKFGDWYWIKSRVYFSCQYILVGMNRRTEMEYSTAYRVQITLYNVLC